MDINVQSIKDLINSNVSAYSIEADTGISRMTITNYRNGKADFMNMSLANALKLSELSKEIIEMKNLKEIGKKLSGTTTEIAILFHDNKEIARMDYVSNGATEEEIESLTEDLSEYDDKEEIVELSYSDEDSTFYNVDELEYLYKEAQKNEDFSKAALLTILEANDITGEIVDEIETNGKIIMPDNFDNLDFIDEINKQTTYTAYFTNDYDGGVIIEK